MKHTPVSLIRDIRAFIHIKTVRESHFARASAASVAAPAGVLALGRELHPDRLTLTVSDKRTDGDGAVTLLLRGDSPRLPAFRPGQYINLLLNDRLFPCFLSGAPAAAQRGLYEVSADPVADPDTFAHLAALPEGKVLVAGPPVGYFFRQPLRDGDSIAVIVDGTGLGAGLAMQKGDHAALYLCRDGDNLPEGKEISAETVFICGRKAFCETAAEAMSGKRIRVMNTDSPERDVLRETYSCTVLTGDDRFRFDCFSDEPLMHALERNGILLLNKCRTGDCSFCRARLTEGNVTHVFDVDDGRRKADVRFGYIHPCRAFPDSDVTLKY